MNYKHGLFLGENRQKNRRIYDIWRDMKKRCLNPGNKDYKWYGAKGITICEEWLTYKNFYDWAMENGYSDELTLDRIDPNKNYTPDNCRWATRQEQVNNRVNTITLQIGNETYPLAEVARRYGIKYETLYYRYKQNWPLNRLLQKVGD